ncbi:MAG: NAD(+) synthase [Alphaproteobacteria bacterium]|nr:NAD(+) synthase [Alphaproteobacteria bacterium]OJV45635.1 MAG: NAD(+) synthase [Alphaproteobacteria bacterium 43-37]
MRPNPLLIPTEPPVSTVCRLALVSVNQTPLAWRENERNILQALSEAQQQVADIIIFPEMSVTGYGLEDILFYPQLLENVENLLRNILPQVGNQVVCLGFPFQFEGKLYNVAAVCFQGKIKGLMAKRTLANTGVYYEPRWFTPWPKGERKKCHILGEDIVIGDWILQIDGYRIGIEICEDAWANIESRPISYLSTLKPSLWINMSGSHFSPRKFLTRQQMVAGSSRYCNGTYVYVNLLGNESGRLIFDGGNLVAQDGILKHKGSRFNFQTSVVDSVDVALPERQPLKKSAKVIHITDFHFKQAKGFAPKPITNFEGESIYEEMTYAVALGLFNLLSKTKQKGFVISLSGGIDSSALLIFCHFMIMHGCNLLGMAGFCKAISHRPVGSLKELTQSLITTIFQATENSSPTSQQLAAALAEEVKSTHFDWNISKIVEMYHDLVAQAMGIQLNWNEHDIALQNIQARVRSPGVWMVANLKGALLLSTSNRSEAAVGYCTMDGDTSGVFAPLAGVSKQRLIRWLGWLQSHEWGRAYPSLKEILRQRPSAQLRPGLEQFDEDDLMPYEILEWLEEHVLLHHYSPIIVKEKIQEDFMALPHEQLMGWVDTFYKLWRTSQWKRERLAPAFHLDTFSVDPKTYLRFPIFSGSGE